MMDLPTILDGIKQEAQRLEKEGLEVRSAYQEAIVTVLRQAAEEQSISPFHQRIIDALKSASSDGRPVSTTALQVRLGIDNRFTMHYHLKKLEKRGLVMRPAGPRSKSGWALAA